jgi:[histone H3]-lysine36 N-trimethyltransferase
MVGVEDSHSGRDPVKEEARGVKMERKDSSNGEVLRSISAVSIKDEGGLNGSTSPSKRTSKQSSSSPVKSQSTPPSPPEKAKTEEEFEEKIGGEITVKMAPGQPPKLARSASQQVVARTAPLFDHFEDKTSEATSKFQVMEACTYTNKNMGYTEHAMECDCTEEWGKS